MRMPATIRKLPNILFPPTFCWLTFALLYESKRQESRHGKLYIWFTFLRFCAVCLLLHFCLPVYKIYRFELNTLWALKQGEECLNFVTFAYFFFFFLIEHHFNCRQKSNWGPGQCFAPQMGSSVCEHQCGSWQGLRRRWRGVCLCVCVVVVGEGWADCNGTCSNSNYPWTHAAVEDLLGPRVAFIITRHRQVLVSASIVTRVPKASNLDSLRFYDCT